MSRLKFSLIGLCCSLFLVGQLASAQVLDDPTKKDSSTQTKTEPPKTEPPKTEPTKTDDKARIIDQAPQTKTVGLNTPVTAEPIKKDVVLQALTLVLKYLVITILQLREKRSH